MNSFSEKILKNVNKVIVGKDDQIELLLISLLVGGHVLLEDVPGTGKTKTAKALAASLDLDFKRVQFTIDKNMPYSDVFKADFARAHITYYGKNAASIQTQIDTAINNVMLQGVDPAAAYKELQKNVLELLND